MDVEGSSGASMPLISMFLLRGVEVTAAVVVIKASNHRSSIRAAVVHGNGGPRLWPESVDATSIVQGGHNVC